MRLLLIRHGETVDNVAQIYAGTRDSPLTSHGALQASRLGSYLASASVKISTIFSSDLKRAFKTAEAIRLAQSVPLAETIKSKLLREKDFGSYEGRSFAERSQKGRSLAGQYQPDAVRSEPDFKEMESKQSMDLRVNSFFDSHLAEPILKGSDGDCIAIVSHGIVLNRLWKACFRRFPLQNIVLAWDLTSTDLRGDLETLGCWSNTGYMDLKIQKKANLPGYEDPPSDLKPLPQDGANSMPEAVTESTGVSSRDATTTLPPTLSACAQIELRQRSFADLHLTVKGSNCRDHLRGLKKTRGGLGSLEHDARQGSLDSFVKRRKI